MADGTFGDIGEKRWDDGDRVGWELPNPFGELPGSLWGSMSEQVQDDVAEWTYSLGLDIGALRPQMPNPAAHHIITAAANDANALLAHVDRYDGRSAAHTARALFEHLVNLMDVTASGPEASDRYLDHRYVTEDQVSRHRWYLLLLNGKSRKRETERLDKLGRRAARPLAAALKRWGPRFRNGWSDNSLYDRADRHGLTEGYDGYRILSGVIHGSSGGLSGLVREVQGTPVHRMGPDMQLAALAYREGLAAVYQLASHLVTLTDAHEAKRLRGLTANLLRDSQEVMLALQGEDNKMWPTYPPPGRLTVAGIYPSGRVRWFVHDTATETIALADPPESEPEQLLAVKAEVIKGSYGGDNGRPITVAMAPDWVRVEPRSGATWVPASSVLVPPGHPGRLPKPILLKPQG